jgi:hypothetical protein
MTLRYHFLYLGGTGASGKRYQLCCDEGDGELSLQQPASECHEHDERFAFKRAVQKAVQNEYNNTPERYFSPINHPEQSTTYARLDELEIRCSIRLGYAPACVFTHLHATLLGSREIFHRFYTNLF